MERGFKKMEVRWQSRIIFKKLWSDVRIGTAGLQSILNGVLY